MELSLKLLALAGAATADGGALVRSHLRLLLGEVAPFDAGEILLRQEGGLQRWSLEQGEEGPIAAEDLLDHVRSLGTPLRLDTLEEAGAFPTTRAQMTTRGLSSLLALPLVFKKHDIDYCIANV
ncbi:MAG TPA: hypothetical protein VKI41_13890, partial [Vicinamibacteria bacterium]|nr:hypothetical protein [Vicinamibacteria bacterium]